MIPGAGHVSNLEAPQPFKDAVREFCRAQPRQTAYPKMTVVDQLGYFATLHDFDDDEARRLASARSAHRMSGGSRWPVRTANGRGLRGVEPEGDGLFRLEKGADARVLLDAARAVGEVRHFGRRRPTLAELFRDLAGRAA